MKRIQALTPFLANQIAAGEVVERPASVVKELVENSIDAHAPFIEIDLLEGGTKRIAVRDNGQGIHPDDLLLALSAHATSKLQTNDDLAAIQTLGFRGEALASIASIARLSLTSAVKDQAAKCVLAEGDMPLRVQAASHGVGTTVVVEDLFFNTPARRKFLRSERTEFSVIDELIKRFALAHPHIHFVLKHNERLVRQYFQAAETHQEMERLKLLCGSDFVDAIVQVDAEVHDYRMRGFVALPPFSRAQADMQYFFVNGRVVRDKAVMHALKMAYQDVLYRERHAAYVLFLTLPCDAVDVNVHPTKSEVRFQDSRLVHDLIRRTVQDALASPKAAFMSGTSVKTDVFERSETEALATPKPFATLQSPYPPIFTDGAAPMPRVPMRAPLVMPTLQQAKMVLDTPSVLEVPSREENIVAESLGHAIAQLHGTYILAENADGLVVVDMHAAHERVLYERLKETHAKSAWASQQLLLPYTLSLNDREMHHFEEASEFLQRFGFDAASASEHLVLVRAVPSVLQVADPGLLIKDVLADWATYGDSARLHDALDQLLASWACRAALHANRALSIPEMNDLLRAMERTPRYRHCNHGRPTTIRFSLAELDQQFMRGR